MPGLADSKLLTAKARERCYARCSAGRWRGRWWWSSTGECDRLGMHVANVEALRRSLARLDVRPSYVLTDGFPVDGLEVPGLAMWKGDRVAACISAASVIAKVTRDRMMTPAARALPGVRLRDAQGLHHARRTPAALERARAVRDPPPPLRQRTTCDG